MADLERKAEMIRECRVSVTQNNTFALHITALNGSYNHRLIFISEISHKIWISSAYFVLYMDLFTLRLVSGMIIAKSCVKQKERVTYFTGTHTDMCDTVHCCLLLLHQIWMSV